MDLPTAVFRPLAQLAASLELDFDVFTAPLQTLVTELRRAVPSYRGLQLTIVLSGQAVTLTDWLPGAADGELSSSLRLPLRVLGPGYADDSQVVFYAAARGAVVALAADLDVALPASAMLVLDADLPPAVLVSGVTGLVELSRMNRAVGLLIGRGRDPDDAQATLRRSAAAAGLMPHGYAAHLLRRNAGGLLR